MYTYICTGAHNHACACRGQRSTLGIFLITLHHLIFDTGSVSEPGDQQLATVDGQWFPRIPVSPSPLHWHHRLPLLYLAFSTDAANPTPGPHAHAASHPSSCWHCILNFQIIKFTSFVWENNFWLIELSQNKKQYVINSKAAKTMYPEKFHKVCVLAFQSWVTVYIHPCLLVMVRAQTRHAGEDAFQKLGMWGQAHHLPNKGSVTSYSSTKEERCIPHRELN